MPRRLALKTSEKPGLPAPSQEQVSGASAKSRKRSRPVPQPALQASSVAIAKTAKIGFDRSCGARATSVPAKHKAPTSRRHKSDKAAESQLQREYFAKNFRAARKDSGLSQRDIQKETGIPQSHISEIESAMHNICIETMVKLANLVHVPVHELLKP
jgi:ribosome-binding protein aMBF1 (putative translation factor)